MTFTENRRFDGSVEYRVYSDRNVIIGFINKNGSDTFRYRSLSSAKYYNIDELLGISEKIVELNETL